MSGPGFEPGCAPKRGTVLPLNYTAYTQLLFSLAVVSAELRNGPAWTRQGLNLRHPLCKSGALPTELRVHWPRGPDATPEPPPSNGWCALYATP